MRPISFILPSRNNLKYLKQAYNSIRRNQSIEHEICIASDASTDGTVEWVEEIMKTDKKVRLHVNPGPERLGHTILYDTLINEYSSNDIVMIFHADMYLCPNSDVQIDKLIKDGTVVSLTRIEPPLHPDGKEKILEDFGIEPEEFKETELLKFVDDIQTGKDGLLYGPLSLNQEISKGIFAPWAIMKKDWDFVGGHDPLFAPQSKEDSDIFNRFLLAGYELIQTWKGFVYHMTCRGSRFKDGAIRNPAGQVFMKGRESDEWLAQNQRSTRNFIRKWGAIITHDEWLHPVIPKVYDIGFVVENCNLQNLEYLEPWCTTIYGDWVGHKGYGVNKYISSEQQNTLYDLSKKIKTHHSEVDNDIILRFDCDRITNYSRDIIQNLSNILSDSGGEGRFEIDIFDVEIRRVKPLEEGMVNDVFHIREK